MNIGQMMRAIKAHRNVSGHYTIDMVGGLWWFLADNHEGQGTDSYELLSRLSKVYDPGMRFGKGPRPYEREFYEVLETL